MADGIVSSLEAAHDQMSQWTVDTWHQLQQELGPRPFGTEQLPQRTQAMHGALIYHDPEAWTSLLQQHGWKGPGTPVPKAVVDYGQRLSKLVEKYPEDAQKGFRAAAGERLMGGQQPIQDQAAAAAGGQEGE